MEQLTENEKKFVAIALQGLAVRQGPKTFQITIDIAKKLNCYAELEMYLKDWINHSTPPEQPEP